MKINEIVSKETGKKLKRQKDYDASPNRKKKPDKATIVKPKKKSKITRAPKEDRSGIFKAWQDAEAGIDKDGLKWNTVEKHNKKGGK